MTNPPGEGRQGGTGDERTPVDLADVIDVLEAHVRATRRLIALLRNLQRSGQRTLAARDASRFIAELGAPGWPWPTPKSDGTEDPKS
jgi:hypothetical protein